MNRLKCFIDVDGVIINSIKTVIEYLEYIKRIPKGSVDYTQVKKWNFADKIPSITNQEIMDAFSSDFFFENVDLFSGAYKNITKLIGDDRFEVIFYSIGCHKNISNKVQFLGNYFNDAQFIMQNTKGIMNKSIVNMNQGVSIFIDDNEDNLFSSNAKFKVLFTQDGLTDKEWNSTWDGWVVKDWDTLYNNIIKIWEIENENN